MHVSLCDTFDLKCNIKVILSNKKASKCCLATKGTMVFFNTIRFLKHSNSSCGQTLKSKFFDL